MIHNSYQDKLAAVASKPHASLSILHHILSSRLTGFVMTAGPMRVVNNRAGPCHYWKGTMIIAVLGTVDCQVGSIAVRPYFSISGLLGLDCCLLLLNNTIFSAAAVWCISVLKFRLFLLLNGGAWTASFDRACHRQRRGCGPRLQLVVFVFDATTLMICFSSAGFKTSFGSSIVSLCPLDAEIRAKTWFSQQKVLLWSLGWRRSMRCSSCLFQKWPQINSGWWRDWLSCPPPSKMDNSIMIVELGVRSVWWAHSKMWLIRQVELLDAGGMIVASFFDGQLIHQSSFFRHVSTIDG